jgi:hypothetical protein
MSRPVLKSAFFALVCIACLAYFFLPHHIWRLNSEITVWHNRQRCQLAKAYRSPDFNFLLVKVPEARRVFLLDLERRYAGVPAYSSDMVLRENVALIRGVAPRSVGPPKLSSKIEWAEHEPGMRYVEITDPGSAVRIYYYR